MQTALADFIRDTPAGAEADRILRACVHCGFCTATCPTYQLLGNELDGPRGRIYQIKGFLEGQTPTTAVREHLDRCLTCLSCESTCPSGVEYGRLLDIGRTQLDRTLERPWLERRQRQLLRWVLPEPRRFGFFLALARTVRPLLPTRLQQKVPPRVKLGPAPIASTHKRRMLLLDGCVQTTLAPEINAAAVRVMDRLGVALERIPGTGCCGAVRLHLGDEDGARNDARRNIDAWWPAVEAGAQAVISASSACALMLKDYGRLLADDPAYADKARKIAGLARDLVEAVDVEDTGPLAVGAGEERTIAFHAPCTLQHGQKLSGRTEALLTRLGLRLTPVAEPHLCCGSAGTYSLLQPELSEQLKRRKLDALTAGGPHAVATANIGCLLQLRAGSALPTVHWIQLLDREP